MQVLHLVAAWRRSLWKNDADRRLLGWWFAPTSKARFRFQRWQIALKHTARVSRREMKCPVTEPQSFLNGEFSHRPRSLLTRWSWGHHTGICTTHFSSWTSCSSFRTWIWYRSVFWCGCLSAWRDNQKLQVGLCNFPFFPRNCRTCGVFWSQKTLWTSPSPRAWPLFSPHQTEQMVFLNIQ